MLSSYALERGPATAVGEHVRTGIAGLAVCVRRTIAHVVAWHRQRATIRALGALDDAALKDIGLSRGGIDAAAVTGRPPRRG